MEKTAKTEQTK